MKLFTQKTIDIVQWVIIIGLAVMLVIQGANYRQAKKDLVTQAEYNKENTYVRIYESQKLNKLKKENKELYDSIKNLKDVESAMIVKFKEHYNTNTITVDKFIVQRDTIKVYDEDNILHQQIDSVYHYAEDNDTVKLDFDVKARELQWVKADFTIHDKFMIINREKDGVNETIINHSDNTSIDGTTMWHRENKEKWYQRFSIGAQVGAGYGIFNHKPDIYVGVGTQFRIW